MKLANFAVIVALALQSVQAWNKTLYNIDPDHWSVIVSGMYVGAMQGL